MGLVCASKHAFPSIKYVCVHEGRVQCYASKIQAEGIHSQKEQLLDSFSTCAKETLENGLQIVAHTYTYAIYDIVLMVQGVDVNKKQCYLNKEYKLPSCK